MRGKIYVISEQGLKLLISSRRRYLAGIAMLALAFVLLGGYALKLHWQLTFERAIQAEAYDPLYDEIMQEFNAVKQDPHLRRYIIAKVLSLAKDYGMDPDLLFALIAVESEFNIVARSPKNARGLGQVMFTTARTINPHFVERPDDLYDVHVNLSSALKYLKANLKQSKDLRKALMVYYYGEAAKTPGFQDRDDYVPRVLSYYALLKTRRFHGTQEVLRLQPRGLQPEGNQPFPPLS